MSFCYARTNQGRICETHKPVDGTYDGQAILSCCFCGQTLAESSENALKVLDINPPVA